MPYGKAKRTPTKSKATYGSGSGMGRKAAAKRSAKKPAKGLRAKAKRYKSSSMRKMAELGL